MTPFEAKGETARWRILYGLLQPAAVGDVITYEQMADALDLHPVTDRHTIQLAVRRAAIESERVDKRALEASPNVGYRIVEPEEHARLAVRQQQRSSRALKSGQSKVVNVDLRGVDPEVVKAFGVMARAFDMQVTFNRRMDVRQRRLESVVAEVSQRQDRSADEVRALHERLERLEGRRPKEEPQT